MKLKCCIWCMLLLPVLSGVGTAAAEELEFERAGILRDRISKLQESIGEPLHTVDDAKATGKGRKGRRRSKATKVPRPKKKQ